MSDKHFAMHAAMAILGALTLLLSACAVNDVASSRLLPANILVWENASHITASQIEPALKEGFEIYWTCYYWRDSESRYALESGAFKKRYNAEFYKNYYFNAWPVKEIAVQEVVNQKKGGVGFKLKIAQKKADASEMRVNEFWDVWLKEEGVWRHKHFDPILPY